MKLKDSREVHSQHRIMKVNEKSLFIDRSILHKSCMDFQRLGKLAEIDDNTYFLSSLLGRQSYLTAFTSCLAWKGIPLHTKKRVTCQIRTILIYHFISLYSYTPQRGKRTSLKEYKNGHILHVISKSRLLGSFMTSWAHLGGALHSVESEASKRRFNHTESAPCSELQASDNLYISNLYPERTEEVPSSPMPQYTIIPPPAIQRKTWDDLLVLLFRCGIISRF